MVRSLCALGLLVVLLAGCGDEATLLLVDVRTDFVVGVEFDRVHVTAMQADGAARIVDTDADPAASWGRGVRVAEVEGLTKGRVELTVELRRGPLTVAERPIVVSLSGQTAITVPIARSCASVVCPSAGGDPAATACHGGLCVDPRCTEETQEYCGDPACTAASDCPPPGGACAVAQCSGGVCLEESDATACGTDEYCDPDVGCRATPTASDGGPPDGALDGGMDAGPDGAMDSGFDGAMDSGLDADSATDSGVAVECMTGAGAVFVSALVGDDVTGAGTRVSPLATISAGLAAAVAASDTAVCVGRGDYAEAVELVEGVSLYGGFQCNSGGCSWTRDVTTYESRIIGVDTNGVHAGATITRATLLDGFTMIGMDAELGLLEHSAAFSIESGTPVITNNRIEGGDVTGTAAYTSTAALSLVGASNAPEGALIQDNVIIGGSSASSASYAVESSPRGSPPTLVLVHNDVRGGDGGFVRAVSAEGTAPGSRCEDNTISAGSAGPTGGSFALGGAGTITIARNRINLGSAVGTCPASVPGFCGGVSLDGAEATLINNVIHGMDAPRSVALRLDNEEVAFSEVVVNGNTLDGGGTSGSAVTTAILIENLMDGDAVVGRFRNNILLGGNGASRYAIYEADAPAGVTVTPAAVENNDMFSVDVAHRRWTGAEVLLMAPSDVNAQPWGAANFGVDPMLDATFHLMPGSGCIDQGTPTDAPSDDFDGEVRPQGFAFDVGADEAG